MYYPPPALRGEDRYDALHVAPARYYPPPGSTTQMYYPPPGFAGGGQGGGGYGLPTQRAATPFQSIPIFRFLENERGIRAISTVFRPEIVPTQPPNRSKIQVKTVKPKPPTRIFAHPNVRIFDQGGQKI